MALDYYFDIDINLETKFIFDLESTYERILKFPNLYIHETKTAQKILMEALLKVFYTAVYNKY